MSRQDLKLQSFIERHHLSYNELDKLFVLQDHEIVSGFHDVDDVNAPEMEQFLRIYWHLLIIPVSYSGRNTSLYLLASSECEVMGWYNLYHQKGMGELLDFLILDKEIVLPDRILNKELVDKEEIYSMLLELAIRERIIFFTYSPGVRYLDQPVGLDWRVALHVSDTFHYACSDAEDVELFQIPKLWEIEKRWGYDGIVAWTAIKRDYPPIDPQINETYLQALKCIGEEICLNAHTLSKLSCKTSESMRVSKWKSTLSTIVNLTNSIVKFIRRK